MREIKFRCFWKQAPKMEYDISSTYDWEMMPLDTCEDDNCVLMQYTGLKDKNGKEIYEGDILDFNGARIIMQWDLISWNPIVIINNDTAKNKYLPNWYYYNDEMKVIGNIYENKDLL